MSNTQKVNIGATLNAKGELEFDSVAPNAVKNLTEQAIRKAEDEMKRGHGAGEEIGKRAGLDLFLHHTSSKTWKAVRYDVEKNQDAKPDENGKIKYKMDALTKLYPPRFPAPINPATGKASGKRPNAHGKLNAQLLATGMWLHQHSKKDDWSDGVKLLQALSDAALTDAKKEHQEVHAFWLEQITVTAGKSSTWKPLPEGVTITKAYSMAKGHAAGNAGEPKAEARNKQQYIGIADVITRAITFREALETLEKAFYDAAVDAGYKGDPVDMSHLVD